MSNSDLIREIWTAYGIESSFGQSLKVQKWNPLNWDDTYRGPFQMDRDIQAKYGLNMWEVFDPDKAGLVYRKETVERTLDDGDWKEWDIEARAADLGISDETLRYMTWQQGRAGVIDIITTATFSKRNNYSQKEYTIKNGVKVKQSYTGTLGNSVKRNINNNMSGPSKGQYPGVKGSGSQSYPVTIDKSLTDQERANQYIHLLNNKWTDKKEESKQYWGPQPDEEVMNEIKLF